MTENEILREVASLACSQGFYGRLYENLIENPDFLCYLADQNFSDTLDMILFLEGS